MPAMPPAVMPVSLTMSTVVATECSSRSAAGENGRSGSNKNRAPISARDGRKSGGNDTA